MRNAKFGIYRSPRSNVRSPKSKDQGPKAYEGTTVRKYADEKATRAAQESVPSGLLEPYIRTLVRSYALGFVHSFRIPRSATLSCQMA